MTDRAALVALLQRFDGRLGELNADLLAGRTPRDLLSRELQESQGQLMLGGEDPAGAIEQAGTAIAAWERAGWRLVTVLEPGYPHNLHLVHDRPPLLFVAGTVEPRDDRAVAVIGTRHATQGGSAAATMAASELSGHGFTIVSGLARGIDTAAHLAVLEAGGRTLAVIGTGLDRSYPPENAHLQQQISRVGAVISCFWPGRPPRPEAFRRRNAVMSGLALGTVVIEAGERSGARVQVRHALGHGRPVFLWPTVLREAWARKLSEMPGVYVVERAGQVAETIDRLSPMDRGTG